MDDPYSAGVEAGSIVGIVIMLAFYAALIAFSVYLYVRVARKCGYSGWYAALCFVPLVNVVVLIMFCFVEWPIERELRELRAVVAGAGRVGYGYPGQAQFAYAQTPYGPGGYVGAATPVPPPPPAQPSPTSAPEAPYTATGGGDGADGTSWHRPPQG